MGEVLVSSECVSTDTRRLAAWTPTVGNRCVVQVVQKESLCGSIGDGKESEQERKHVVKQFEQAQMKVVSFVNKRTWSPLGHVYFRWVFVVSPKLRLRETLAIDLSPQ